jgi:hypothetical protein
MNLSVSPQIRLVALVGVLALLGLSVTVFALGRRSTTHTGAPAAVAPSPVRPHAVGSPVQTPSPAGSRPAAHAALVNPVVAAARAQGWPLSIARAFVGHRVVAVELYSSDAPLDRDALAEASAGTKRVGAILVPLDVSLGRDAAARAVLHKIGVVDSPALLVLHRPGTVFARLDGFQDQGSVSQAVANASVPLASAPASTGS